MQNIYKCKHFKPNENLNKTCTKNKKRCILISEQNCYEYERKEVLKQKKSGDFENFLDTITDFENFLDTITNNEDNYRSALEEINLILDELKQQYDYMTDYSEIKEIQNRIDEVLGNESKQN